MKRTITSNSVKGYSSHVPLEEVTLTKDEALQFKKGTLTSADGKISCKLMTQVVIIILCSFSLRIVRSVS